MTSVAYGLWLHRMTGSATEATRFAASTGPSTPGPENILRSSQNLPGLV
ncbi:hypothetical protein ACFXMT_25765 [Streptomyces mirabilis]